MGLGAASTELGVVGLVQLRKDMNEYILNKNKMNRSEVIFKHMMNIDEY